MAKVRVPSNDERKGTRNWRYKRNDSLGIPPEYPTRHPTAQSEIHHNVQPRNPEFENPRTPDEGEIAEPASKVKQS